MSEAEAAFLREQVLRLNNELARAQNRPALTHEEGEEAAPWLASSEHLPPLLSATGGVDTLPLLINGMMDGDDA